MTAKGKRKKIVQCDSVMTKMAHYNRSTVELSAEYHEAHNIMNDE